MAEGISRYHLRSIPRTHDLEELANLCRQCDTNLQLPTPELAEITDFAVQIRYDLEAWPTQEEAGEALAQPEQVRETLLNRLPADLCGP